MDTEVILTERVARRIALVGLQMSCGTTRLRINLRAPGRVVTMIGISAIGVLVLPHRAATDRLGGPRSLAHEAAEGAARRFGTMMVMAGMTVAPTALAAILEAPAENLRIPP